VWSGSVCLGGLYRLVLSIGLFWYWDFSGSRGLLAGSIAIVASLGIVPLVSLLTPQFKSSGLDEIFSTVQTARPSVE